MWRTSTTGGPVAGLLALLVLAVVIGTGSSCTPPKGGVMEAKRLAWMQLNPRGWATQSQCLVDLWQVESGWNVHALNPASGAYGIPQALPAVRMAAAGNDWLRNPATQIRWGLNYIKQRYGGPCNAWRFWRAHHWYVKPNLDTATPRPLPPAAPVATAPTAAPATLPTRRTSDSPAS